MQSQGDEEKPGLLLECNAATDNGGRKAGRLSMDSVYALTPHESWLQPSWACAVTASTCVAVLSLCFLPFGQYYFARPIYSAVAVAGLLYRVYYYMRKEWMMYFIDLCFLSTILLVFSMWYCEGDRCSSEWKQAIFLIAQGPVAGATFLLQTPLTLHHPEAFESFFLHVSPMWILYAMRWRWLGDEAVPEVGTLVWAGFSQIYIPWVVVYTIILLLQPWMPDKIAGYETLADLILFPARDLQERITAKRQYLTFAGKILAYVASHCFASITGLLAAAFAYRCHAVQVVWIVTVLLGSIYSGIQFYTRCANPEGFEPPPITDGVGRMCLAWVAVLLALFFAC